MLNRLVELDVQTLEEIRTLLNAVLPKVLSRHLNVFTSHPEEIASEVEDELINSIQVTGRRMGKLSSLVGGNAVYRAGEIKDLLKDVPDDRTILSQIVGSESGVYNAYFEVGILNNGDGPVVMSAGHPQLKHLPMEDMNDVRRNQAIDEMIEQLNKLR